MSDVTTNPVGSFCWPELLAADAPAARSFYDALFGFTHDPVPAGSPGAYTILKLRGRDAAGLLGLVPEQAARGVTTRWMPYVKVASADAAAAVVTAAGGALVAPPFDVPGIGRMAAARDPHGHPFGLWQSGTHDGVRVEDEPGTACWWELATTDVPASTGFYGRVCGWGVKAGSIPGMAYDEWQNAGRPIGGVCPASPEITGIPKGWGVYFRVEDADAAVSKTTGLGGRVVTGPLDVPGVGRMATLADPQGALFSVIRLAPPAG